MIHRQRHAAVVPVAARFWQLSCEIAMIHPPPPRLFQWLGQLQASRPWAVLLLALLTLVPAGFGAAGLTFKPDFAELLPDGKESVIEMRRVSARLPGASTLSLYVQTREPNPQALEAFVDAVAPRLQGLGPEWVGSVDAGVKDSQQFFEKHKLLYADYDDLKKAHDEVVERYDYEVAKAAGTLLDEQDAPPPLSAERIKQRLQGDRGAQKAEKRDDAYPRGYYENAEGTYAAVLVRTPVSGSVRTAAFRQKVEAVVAEVDPKRFDPSMEVHYTGGLITSAEEYNAIVNDLAHVGGLGVLGVLGSVLLFFRRVRTVLVMGGALLVGLLWTFGLTRLTIGYLNSSTGFLVSIIAGNGINYGIMYMARYLEARRDGSSVEEAILVAHRDSWVPTLASAATAMLAYGSLVFTDFRGFKHFGVIGSYGMILCWACAYLFAPAILAATERVWPAFREGKREDNKGVYGLLFARLAMNYPRLITAGGAALAVISLGMTVRYFSADPMEYDMTNIRNERRDKTAAGELSKKVDRVVGQIGQDGLAIMTERLDQVPALEAELNRRRAAAPADKAPFDRVVTIFSLLPSRQEEKLPLLEEMLDKIQRSRKRGFIPDKDWAELEPHLPSGELRALTIEDLPAQVVRPFLEKDGTRGRIVYISPTKGFSVWDAHYLMRWADSFRSTTLPNGEVIKGSGQAVIFADMIKTIGEDAPRAILVAALGSILVIVVAFRGKIHALGVFLPWLVGVSSLVAFLQFRGIKLNFLNFVALPITIGIGAEYAHNLMQRYRIEGDRNLYRVVVETGGAVVLCALTTTIGYLALLGSINKGIVSFGLSAAVGEITCILAAVLMLPAFLFWRAGQRKKQGKVFEGEAHFVPEARPSAQG
jgi:predicted RND superfamily exporter protein